MLILNSLIIAMIGVGLLIAYFLVQIAIEYYQKNHQKPKKNRYFVEIEDVPTYVTIADKMASSLSHSQGEALLANQNKDDVLVSIPLFREVFEKSVIEVKKEDMVRPQLFQTSDQVFVQWLTSLQTTHKNFQEILRNESPVVFFPSIKK